MKHRGGRLAVSVFSAAPRDRGGRHHRLTTWPPDGHPTAGGDSPSVGHVNSDRRCERWGGPHDSRSPHSVRSRSWRSPPAGSRPRGTAASGTAQSGVGCALGGAGQAAHIQHVIYLQFDNTHYNRDNPNVASDLEQMPHLLNFLKDERHALHERPHDPHLAHRGRDPQLADRPLPGPAGPDGLEQLRLLPGEQDPDASRARSSTGRTPSTRSDDPLPNMITDGQKNDARAVGAVHARRL